MNVQSSSVLAAQTAASHPCTSSRQHRRICIVRLRYRLVSPLSACGMHQESAESVESRPAVRALEVLLEQKLRVSAQ